MLDTRHSILIPCSEIPGLKSGDESVSASGTGLVIQG